MTQDEIIEMARQAGALQISFNTFSMQHEYSMFPKELEAFAKLVAEHEREACVKIVDENIGFENYLSEIIRAKGQA